MVILGAGTLTLIDLDEDGGLVVGVGGEDLLLLGGDSGVAANKDGHDTTSSLNTEREGSNIEEKKVLNLLTTLTSENGGLNGGTISNGLIRVDALVELLAVEEVLKERLDLGNTGGTTDKDNIVDLALIELGVTKALLNRLHALTEEVHAELLETSTGDVRVEVNTLIERIELNGGLSSAGKSTLGTLASSAETTESTGVVGDILLVLALELLDEVGNETVIEILTTEMGITGSGLNLKNTLINGQKRNIEGTATEIEDKDVALTNSGGLLVETVGNSGSSGLVDNTENLKTSDGTGILGSLTLGVVEVSGDSDDSPLNNLVVTDESLGSLLHLDKDHGRNLLSGEGLGLSLVLNLDERLVTGARDNGEGPVLHVILNNIISELAANKTLSVEDRVPGVHGDLVLGGITNKALSVGEGDIRRSSTVTLVVGDDLDAVVLPNTNATVGGTEVNTDSGSVPTHVYELL
mmetsp:Transcript_6983/g.13721  ORF Transcript_6983/g.13721 Transcript_6983/m.13721 type:complete len:466 (-) Transcript_6983:90-1487(-)